MFRQIRQYIVQPDDGRPERRQNDMSRYPTAGMVDRADLGLGGHIVFQIAAGIRNEDAGPIAVTASYPTDHIRAPHDADRRMKPMRQSWHQGAEIAPGVLEFRQILIAGIQMTDDHIRGGHKSL